MRFVMTRIAQSLIYISDSSLHVGYKIAAKLGDRYLEMLCTI